MKRCVAVLTLLLLLRLLWLRLIQLPPPPHLPHERCQLQAAVHSVPLVAKRCPPHQAAAGAKPVPSPLLASDHVRPLPRAVEPPPPPASDRVRSLHPAVEPHFPLAQTPCPPPLLFPNHELVAVTDRCLLREPEPCHHRVMGATLPQQGRPSHPLPTVQTAGVMGLAHLLYHLHVLAMPRHPTLMAMYGARFVAAVRGLKDAIGSLSLSLSRARACSSPPPSRFRA